MIISQPKPIEEIRELASDFQALFILACGGCPIGCKSGGKERIKELADELGRGGKDITGSAEIDFLCNKALVGTQLQYHLPQLKKAQAILVISCGIGVQAVGKMIDLPALPANNTLSSQGMQGLWPSEERCAGCGDCLLHLTGGICPITSCSKSLLNGMCGGQRDGKCEVDPERDCGWYLIYNRLKELGRLDNLKRIPPLRDYRKLDVPGPQRATTRWALEKREIFEAPNWMDQ
ncbi:TPA: 5,10-methylenetetrahydrofolate reductase [Candidatus Poribacteria bacterium]|nr:5,10-methylenetetrahydrofolate reductase [Candidatus Poribacteria bacterium]